MKDRTEKNLPEEVRLAAPSLSTMVNVSPAARAGTLVEQGRIHLPLQRASHVPHSPFPQPYLMYCPACERWARRKLGGSRAQLGAAGLAGRETSPAWPRRSAAGRRAPWW